VIVVIGILSAMMMIASSEIVASAKANNIIVGLHQWKKAALAWYLDNIDRIDDKGRIKEGAIYSDSAKLSNFAENVKPSEIAKYLNNFTPSEPEYEGSGLGKYYLKDTSGGKWSTDHYNAKNNAIVWLIGYEMPTDDARVKAKLAGRAASAGLVYKSAYPLPKYTAEGSNHHRVWIEVIDFSK
ncbi:MAG: hypothetical protein IJU07_01605, partial [Synergistaceae bacterium]|nr:hypothetical protein [Synergistaceae bacterium]